VVRLLCEGNEDQIVALLTAIREDHSRDVKGVYFRGRRELINLKCSINYENSGAPSRQGKGTARFFSIEHFVWVLGLRAFGVLWGFFFFWLA
jgi:hypothetical protein